MLAKDRHNKQCLEIVDNALFMVCLDDAAPENLADLCSNFLCGTYNLQDGEQVGTCTNRWYDKVGAFFWNDFYAYYPYFYLYSFKSSSARMVLLASILSIPGWMAIPF